MFDFTTGVAKLHNKTIRSKKGLKMTPIPTESVLGGQVSVQGAQLNMSVFFWYLAKSVTSVMYVYSTPMKSLNCSHIVCIAASEPKIIE